MTLRVKLEIAAAVLALLLGGIGLHEWLSEHDARLRAEQTVEAQKAVQAAYSAQVADLAKQMADRDAAYQTSLKTLDAKFQSAATPSQIATLVSQLMGLKQPLTVIQPPASAENPHPEAIVQVPSIDFPQAKTYIQECETCKLNITKTQADLADRQKQAELAQQQIDSLKKENSSLQVAVKGGTVLQRTLRTVKWLAIGAAAGYVAGHKF